MGYQDTRGKIEREIFRLISPEHTSGSRSISLILAGQVPSQRVGETGYYIDSASVATGSYILQGVGIKHEGVVDYGDTLQSCSEVWIPILDTEGKTHTLKFEVGFRSFYSGSTYLWNTGSSVVVSGSWVANGIRIADEDPYSESTEYVSAELDYSCTLPAANSSVLFVDYIPERFEYDSDYNALLNNAYVGSENQHYLTEQYIRKLRGTDKVVEHKTVKLKKYIIDNHKLPALGGFGTGEIPVSGGWSRRIDQLENYVDSFCEASNRYWESGSGVVLQTLDLAFLNFRAISASVYVDRLEYGTAKPIEEVWKTLQEGNTDDPEIVYFAPRCELSTESKEVSSDPVFLPQTPNYDYYLWGKVSQIGARTSIPDSGSILFKVDGHTPVRYVQATVYAPFLNTVYRTDKYGVVTELYSGSGSTS